VEAAEEIADQSATSPAAAMEEAERNQQLWAAVEKLDPKQAMAVELYYRRDWPLEKVAEALGCPVGTVKTMLFRAREQLRQTLLRQEVVP
jgi:RNA polymerase sigma-70 factor (ECF subfamily)